MPRIRIPKPNNVLDHRATATEALQAIRANRHIYVLECVRVFLRLPKSEQVRMKFCLDVADCAREAGLYAKASYLRDIAYSFIRRFYELSSPRSTDWRHAYDHWRSWRAKEYVNFDLLTAKGQRRAAAQKLLHG